jgi:hypothetical protein
MAFVLLAASGLTAQVGQDKRFEFSTSASIWNVKWYGDESTTIINIPLRLGVFLFKGLELEPELSLTIPEEGEDTGILILGNVSYNFKASKNVFPFVLAGIGYGNAVPMLGWAWDVEEKVIPVNFGAGIKAFVGDSAAVRVEYRFTKFYEADQGLFKSDGDVRTHHNFLIGISLFF